MTPVSQQLMPWRLVFSPLTLLLTNWILMAILQNWLLQQDDKNCNSLWNVKVRAVNSVTLILNKLCCQWMNFDETWQDWLQYQNNIQQVRFAIYCTFMTASRVDSHGKLFTIKSNYFNNANPRLDHCATFYSGGSCLSQMQSMYQFGALPESIKWWKIES